MGEERYVTLSREQFEALLRMFMETARIAREAIEERDRLRRELERLKRERGGSRGG